MASSASTPRPTPWNLRLAITLIAVQFVGQIFFFSVAIAILAIARPDALSGPLEEMSGLAGVVLSGSAYLFAAAVALELTRHFAGRLGWPSWRDAVAMRPSRAWPLGIGVALVTAMASDGLSLLIGRPIIPLEYRPIFADLAAGLLFGLFSVTIPPVVEEVIFHGVLYPASVNSLGRPNAIALNALAFGAVHIFTYGLDWYLIFTTTLFGLVLVLLRAYTNSLWPSIAAHFALNAYASLEGLILPRLLGYWP